jgi:uncharacterized protein
MKTAPTADQAIAATREWLEKAVIGLNLCPFAKPVFIAGRIRFVVSEAKTPGALLDKLADELEALQAADPQQIETTLLVHPNVLTDFLDYNDFLEAAEALIEELGHAGGMQLASFHPDYQFDGTAPGDIENYSNRSPYPTLHLLREDSVTRAVETMPDTGAIYERNMATLRALGHAGWQRLFDPDKVTDDGGQKKS